MMVTIKFRLDNEEHILTAEVWEMDADGALEHPVTADSLDELRPEWAAAIRKYVSETGELAGEIEIG